MWMMEVFLIDGEETWGKRDEVIQKNSENTIDRECE